MVTSIRGGAGGKSSDKSEVLHPFSYGLLHGKPSQPWTTEKLETSDLIASSSDSLIIFTFTSSSDFLGFSMNFTLLLSLIIRQSVAPGTALSLHPF
jgi:hypothetical protein